MDLAGLAASWQIHLRAQGKSPNTVRSYTAGVAAYLAWCASSGRPAQLDRGQVAGFTAGLLDAGRSPATANLRHRSLRAFAAWLVSEGQLPASPLAGLAQPRPGEPAVPKLSDAQLAGLIAACQGTGFRDRRDEAIVRLMAETGVRADELLGMRTADVDLGRGLAVVVRGKGGRGRIVPFSPQAARALDRYLRARRGHRRAQTAAVWLGDRGRGLGYDGLYSALRRRAAAAGIGGFHPHRLRHTAASRWLAAGGSEGGLMAVAGWRSRDMLDRYVADTAAERAADEARRLGLGEI